ncbi:MAG: nucleotidyltransferase domain-containing protein [Candidatus Schekmanbacteria bacterium]|nr:nucleotidyltransferase domain-containing protein [Candidatus Schekmanbacteria bacterium]
MVKREVLKAVKFFRNCLEEKEIDVTKIVLFGSQQRGNAVNESDIDIVLVSSDFRRKSLVNRLMLIKDAEVATIKKFMVPLDVILMTPEEFCSDSSIVAGYARSGEVLV